MLLINDVYKARLRQNTAKGISNQQISIIILVGNNIIYLKQYSQLCNTETPVGKRHCLHQLAVYLHEVTAAIMWSDVVRVPSSPYKRYWVAKMYDKHVSKEVYAVLNRLWCQSDTLKCQFPSDLIVNAKVKLLAERLRPADAEWITFDYVYFSQTGNSFIMSLM